MKYMLNLRVTENRTLNADYCLLKLTHDEVLPAMLPGQFVEVLVEGSPTTFLRRPISINFVDKSRNELWLLIRLIGDGTRQMAAYRQGDIMNLLLPLGNSFSMPEIKTTRTLLTGGGVGTAPMLFLGAELKNRGIEPTFLLGARSEKDLLQLDEFRRYGRLFTTTEDGSAGEKGYLTQHSVLNKEKFDIIYSCGPKPMMMAVADYACKTETECEVSLENTMACGIGACLCCVEDTKQGNVCVCTEGPVFNTKRLKWHD
ncbi:MAG: dihydroorotate dehydrogenase electron transfer subunit [Bacteroidales bacterium]|nr:dihydroorotate dehydrogenase electron transfer subunit [Bacteroidales bacterium]